jgi:hypothetical protein
MDWEMLTRQSMFSRLVILLSFSDNSGIGGAADEAVLNIVHT